MLFARLTSVAIVASLTACGGKTDDASVDASFDASAPESSTIDATLTDGPTRDARDADLDADACRRYSESATCCEGTVSYGDVKTLCPGVTCRTAYLCDHGDVRTDDDGCHFSRDKCVDSAVPPDTRDADAEPCFRYFETATCCEGVVTWGPEMTLCPGVTCQIAYRCDHGATYEDHDYCFFSHDKCVDAAVPPDALDAADTADTPADTD